MRARKSGHIINVSSIGVQTNPPRFSAYVASKAALDAFSRVIASEVIDDGVHITTIHMPLVRTPMIAPTQDVRHLPDDHAGGGRGHDRRGDDRPAEEGRDAAGDLRGAALRAWRRRSSDAILNPAYKLFPESQAAKGKGEEAPDEAPSTEGVAFAHLMKGVHW